MRPIEKVTKVSELELKFKRSCRLLRLGKNEYFDDHIFYAYYDIAFLNSFYLLD